MAKKETTTKNFILRIDSDTMSAIEAWAADEFRSTNGQLQWIITEALRKAHRLPKAKSNDKSNAITGWKNFLENFRYNANYLKI